MNVITDIIKFSPCKQLIITVLFTRNKKIKIRVLNLEHTSYLLNMELPKKLQMQVLNLFMNCSLDCTQTFFQTSLHQLQGETSGAYSLLLLLMIKWRLSSLRTPLGMALPKIETIIRSIGLRNLHRKNVRRNSGFN
jgi:hypothetical protein